MNNYAGKIEGMALFHDSEGPRGLTEGYTGQMAKKGKLPSEMISKEFPKKDEIIPSDVLAANCLEQMTKNKSVPSDLLMIKHWQMLQKRPSEPYTAQILEEETTRNEGKISEMVMKGQTKKYAPQIAWEEMAKKR